MDVEQGRRAALKLLDARITPPDVVMAVNDLVAIGALKALKERDLRWPEDVLVTDYNDIPPLGNIDLPLTSVAKAPRIHIETRSRSPSRIGCGVSTGAG